MAKSTAAEVAGFNSRTPGGVRLASFVVSMIDAMFQFTHPGRGATLCSLVMCQSFSCFNSRTPGGVRHQFNPFRLLAYQFQFTHPGRGATEAHYRRPPCPEVSIHAPREGCDSTTDCFHEFSKCFNSRTPGGVRPLNEVETFVSNTFQFTHPGRGATHNILI